MKYEDILKWRMDVYEATIASAAAQEARADRLKSSNRTPAWSTTATDGTPPAIDTSRTTDYAWAPLPGNAATNLPLPGQDSPHDGTQQRKGHIDEAAQAEYSPLPVPAVLAPAQGQVPKILKRPVSASFSSGVHDNDRPKKASSPEPMNTRSRSHTMSSEDAKSATNYALGLLLIHEQAGDAVGGGGEISTPRALVDMTIPEVSLDFAPLQRTKVLNRF